MKLSDYAKKLGIKYKTAWLWYSQGKIEGYKTKTGTIIVTEFDEKELPTEVVIYARVSSHEMKDNLDRQAERLANYCAAKGWRVSKVVKEIGSGVNDNRKQLTKLLEDTGIKVIVVEHRDRLTRFGFNYIEKLLESQNRRIEVINLANNSKDELMEDLTSIIYSFSARMYGQRRAKRKTERIKRELQDEAS